MTGDDDNDALRDALGDVKPLKGDKRVVPKGTPDTAAGASSGAAEVTLRVLYDNDGVVVGSRKDTHTSILDALEDPGLDIDDSVDLHGQRFADAKREVAKFIRDAHKGGDRWLLIITGKGLHSPGGEGSLRDAAIETLSKGSSAWFVLAFRNAPLRHGGTGALVVRLIDRV